LFRASLDRPHHSHIRQRQHSSPPSAHTCGPGTALTRPCEGLHCAPQSFLRGPPEAPRGHWKLSLPTPPGGGQQGSHWCTSRNRRSILLGPSWGLLEPSWKLRAAP
jgi:hypothetical protein